MPRDFCPSFLLVLDLMAIDILRYHQWRRKASSSLVCCEHRLELPASESFCRDNLLHLLILARLFFLMCLLFGMFSAKHIFLPVLNRSWAC